MAPTLLDCWACRDLARFRAVLKGGAASATTNTSGAAFSPRSPAHRSVGGNASAPCPPAEVNRKDHLGRTVLHLIASSTEPAAVDWLVAVLAHPSTNVNVGDGENGWTPLHRALYHGNLLTAQLLLRRTTGSGPADARLKDLEGLTPYDLYNSTVAGSAPARTELVGALVPAPLGAATPAGELFAWGANRNYSLGHGDGADRALPDRVRIDRVEETLGPNAPPGSRYERIGVRDVGMSKFATIVLTDEKSANVRCAGVGAVGRIGRAPQTQTKLEPLRDFTDTAAAIAVGPDHTCIVTTTGALYTFGHNRFQQLGYALEHGQGLVASSTASKGSGGAASATFGANAATTTPASELDVQLTPRRVAGALKKEQLIGSAAGKLHSAAFSAEALYTWGTNTGQLGYDRAASPVQVSPRKVTALANGQIVRQVAVTDFATACLLATGDVLLLHNDAHFIVRFPQPGFSSNMSVFQPRQAIRKPLIKKLTAGSSNLMAAISDMGDVFTFSLGHPSEYVQGAASASAAGATGGGATRQAVVKPQLVWSVRKNKKVGAAEYVALGAGSDIILTTESGHVFVRSRPQESTAGGSGGGGGSAKGKSGWKAVPLLQRIVKVATNESGGFAAIKADAPLRDIRPRGRSLEEDMLDLLPHLKAPSHAGASQEEELSNITAEMAAIGVAAVADAGEASDEESEEDSDAGESSTERHVRMAQLIGEAAKRLRFDKRSLDAPPFGTDAFIIAGGRYLPTHRAVLAARIPALAKALASPARSGLAPAGVVVKLVGASEDAEPRSTSITTIELPKCSFHTALLLLHYLYSDDLPAIWTASVGLRVASSSKLEPTQVRAQLHELAKLLDLSALTPCLSSPVPRAPSATLRASLHDFFSHSVEVDVTASPLHDVELRLADRVVPAHSALLRRSPFFAALLQPHWTFARWNEGVISIDMVHMRWDVAKLVLLHLYTDTSGAELFRGTDAERSVDEWIDFVTEVLAAANELLLDKLKLLCCALLRRRVTPSNVASLISDAEFYHALPLKDATMDYSARTLETLLEGGMLEDLEVKLVRDLTRFVRQRQDERMHRTQASDHIAALIVQHQEYFDSLDIPPPSLNLISTKVGRRPPRTTPLPSTGGRGSLSPYTSPELKPVASSLAPPTPAGDGGFMFSMDEDEDASAATPSAAPGGTPWRAVSVEAEKAASRSSTPRVSGVDLRSIMASEQATRRPSPSTPGSAVPSGAATPVKLPPSANTDVVPLSLSSKLSQRDRKKQLQLQQQAQTAASPSASATTWSPTFSSLRDGASSSAGTTPRSAWKTPEAKPGMQAVPPFSLDAASPTRPSVRSAPRTSLEGASTASAGTPLNAMGPTFTPQRGVPRPVQKRVVSGESAWGGAALTPPSSSARPIPPFSASPQLRPVPSPAPFPTPPPSSTPPIKSFAAIQAEEQLRLEASAAAQASAKKTSFAQLIEEDRKANERREQEERDREAFEAWFEEEAKRLRIEEGGPSTPAGGARRGSKAKKGANGAAKEKTQQQQQQGGKKEKRGPKTAAAAGPSQAQEGAAPTTPTGPKNNKPRNNGGGGANRGKPRGSNPSHADSSAQPQPAATAAASATPPPRT